MDKFYIEVKNYKNYDYYYLPIGEDKTWGSVLRIIESILDERYIENDDNLAGIKLSVKIVDSLPEDLIEEWQ
jgi:hypothetical protein